MTLDEAAIFGAREVDKTLKRALLELDPKGKPIRYRAMTPKELKDRLAFREAKAVHYAKWRLEGFQKGEIASL